MEQGRAQVRWHKAQVRLIFPERENIIVCRRPVTIVLIDVFSAYIKLLYLSVVFDNLYKKLVLSSYMKVQPSLAPRNGFISNISTLKKLTYSIHRIIVLKISEIPQKEFHPYLCLVPSHLCHVHFHLYKKVK